LEERKQSSIHQGRSNGTRPRFPLPRYPTGWFQVGWQDDLGPGDVEPLEFFGKDLVMFRTEAGEVKVLDAHCPHLGAHLGHGGVIKGDDIVCPFHAWKFNGAGECTEIPYAKKIPKKATMDCWPVRLVNGLIMVWHDIDHNPPAWDVPVLPEFGSEDWSEPVKRTWRFRTHNQEMAENVVDTAHFKYLHGTVNQPEAMIEHDGPMFHMVSPTIMTTPAGQVKGQIESYSHGLGFASNRFTGLVETLLMGNVTPVDDEYVQVHFTFIVKKFAGADATKGVGRAFVAEISRQLEQDRPVWENKVYFDRPVLCDGDGPFMTLRKWGRQFFPDWYWQQARDAYYGQASASKISES
jgi:phenylpropionate dioxygenase-like ring-hydroxylating dioxygenase large terminal subunit